MWLSVERELKLAGMKRRRLEAERLRLEAEAATITDVYARANHRRIQRENAAALENLAKKEARLKKLQMAGKTSFFSGGLVPDQT